MIQSESIFGALRAEPAAGQTEHTAETAQPTNPVVPKVPELVWSAAMFLLLWALLKFWLLKPILRTMAERSEKIRGDVEAADTARNRASGALTEYEASLASARVEASQIIDEARAQADDERKRLMAAAEAEVAELRAAANAEVSAAKSVALTSMRSQVATIAVEAAEIVVQKRLDAAAQRAIVDEFLNRSSQNYGVEENTQMQLVSTLVLAAETGAHEANSFLLPHDLAEAAWSGLASLIIFGLLWWKAGPPLTAMARSRTQKIATEITDAERVRTDAEGKLDDVNHRIANATDERQRILVEARQTAEALKQQIQHRAEAEAEALKVRAAADIESAKTQAIADLQAEVADLALRAAEAVVLRNLDAGTQNELIDGYIEQVGAAPGTTERGF